MARKKIVAGNWKMNMTPSQAVKLVEELKPLVVSDSVEVVYCVPAIDIVPVVEAVKGTNVAVGAENMYFEEKGAYTGEISAEMLVDAGVKYVVLGHSERREYFKEDDVLLNKKVKKAFEAGLTPILCCGETLEQREMGVTLLTGSGFRSSLIWLAFRLLMLLRWLSLTSQSGQSEQERRLLLTRLRKFAALSVSASRKFMMRLLQSLFVSSTADLLTPVMQLSFLQSLTLTVD